tara:strand:+ start:1216 stop:1359 length:144 start_codon:yes stop_codon:yes gene_type:complete
MPEDSIMIYAKSGVIYLRAKKPVNVITIEKKGSISKNFFQKPVMVEV